jgi:hypothetical protein
MAVSQPIGEARQNGFRVSPILLCPLRCANTIGAATVGRNTICLTKLLVLRFFSAYRRRATSKKTGEFLLLSRKMRTSSHKSAGFS